MEQKGRTKDHTTDGKEPTTPEGTAPQPIDPVTGQHLAYWVLSEEERQGGFVRPIRKKYIHGGVRPKYPRRDLTEEEKARWKDAGYISFEAYPPESPESDGGLKPGRFWTQQRLSTGCGTGTTMGKALAETWAKKIDFYGATFCFHCNNHFLVEEFQWEDGSTLGT